MDISWEEGYFHAVISAHYHHKAVFTGDKPPKELPQFHWINNLLFNLKTSFCDTSR